MTQKNHKLKCHFPRPLVTQAYSCEYAHQISNREGPGIACQDQDAHQRCGLTFNTLKSAAFPALGISDDLATMPSSAISKIQFGGLMALSHETGKDDSIDNINAVVVSIHESYENLEDLNFGSIINTIKNYKLRQRRQK